MIQTRNITLICYSSVSYIGITAALPTTATGPMIEKQPTWLTVNLPLCPFWDKHSTDQAGAGAYNDTTGVRK